MEDTISEALEIRPDPEGGYEVVDVRDGEAIAWRGYLSSAAECAEYLTRTYCGVWPAHDTLVHDIVCARIGGEIR